MKKRLLLGTVICGALALNVGSLMAAPKDDVKSAVDKLAAQANYSWHTSVDNGGAQGGRGGRGAGPMDGKTEKDGFTVMSMVRGDNTIEAVLKGDKGIVKTPEGWKTLAEADQSAQAGGGQGGRGNPMRGVVRMLQTFKAPAAEAADLLTNTTELKTADDAHTGGLTEEAAKAMLSFGRRGGGGNAPTPTNVRGSVKFWVKDGVLSKYESNVQGTVNFNGNNQDINRTTTVEIKDAGVTKVNVVDEVKQKLQ